MRGVRPSVGAHRRQLICYIGWLFPLWDAKRQTIGDKIMTTWS
jgi:hypothetical protein